MGEKLKELEKVPDSKVTALQNKLKDLASSREFEIAQGVVDAAGIVDPTPISDGVSAVMSLAKGDWLGAGLSVASMIPYIGDAAAKTVKASRAAKRLTKLADDIAKTTKELLDAVQKRTVANRKAAAKAAQEARRKAANACKPCSAEQKWGSHLPRTGWDPPGSRGNGKWTSKDGKVTVEYKDGYPDFSTATAPDMDKRPIVLDRVELTDMKGNYSSDFTSARNAMREKTGKRDWPGNDDDAPTGYTWHHKEDGATMELVRTDVHDRSTVNGGSGAAHTGGASVVNDKVF